MKRSSSLNVLQYCGASDTFPGAGRAAAMSSAFHARASNEANAGALIARLTPEEFEELQTWKPVADFALYDSTFTYADAVKERRFYVDREGNPVEPDPTRPEEYITEAALTGKPDMYWVDKTNGVVIIGDIKKSRWTSKHPNDSLQHHSYGLMICAHELLSTYIPGTWVADEGFWIWGDEVDTYSGDTVERWSVIQACMDAPADEFSHGPHCDSCYGRLQCPAHMVGLDGTLVVPGEGFPADPEPDEATVAQLLIEGKRRADQGDAMIKYAKAWAKKHGNFLRDGDSIYAPVECKGRKSADVKALEAAGLDEYIKQGAPYDQWRWTHKKAK